MLLPAQDMADIRDGPQRNWVPVSNFLCGALSGLMAFAESPTLIIWGFYTSCCWNSSSTCNDGCCQYVKSMLITLLNGALTGC